MGTAAEKKADKANEEALGDAGVATPSENSELEHSQGGVTTRDDANDLGVPMLPGSPDERQGPEDALGEGPKRGDYRERIVGNPHTVVSTDDGSKVVAQKPRAEDIGDAEGLKGGVDTDPAAS